MNDATRTQIRLFALVVLAFLPAVAMYVIARENLRVHERGQQEQELTRIAALAAVDYQRLIDESRELLGALAEFPEIRSGAGKECNQRLARVLRHTPQFTTLSVIGPAGYMTCGSLSVGGDLYLGDRAYYLLATTRHQFSVGEYAVGRITGKPTVGVAYPIAEGTLREVQRVLAAALDLSAIGESRGPLELPPHVTLTVLDRKRNVLVRRPVAGRDPLGHDSIGAVAPATFPTMPAPEVEPTLIAGTDLDSVERLFAVASLGADDAPRGWVVVGKEQAMLLTEIEDATRRELRFLAASGGVLLVLTWLLGHYGLGRTRGATA